MSASIDIRIAKAMAHPIRARALHILNERVASPSDIAKELELPVANVSYHVNTLLRLKCIEEVETQVVRGAIEHMYRAVRQPLVELDDAEEMPASVRGSLCGEVLKEAIIDARDALEAGVVERRSNLHWTTTSGELDEQAFGEIHDILRAAYAEIEARREEARERIKAGAKPIPWRLTVLHYETKPKDEPEAKPADKTD